MMTPRPYIIQVSQETGGALLVAEREPYGAVVLVFHTPEALARFATTLAEFTERKRQTPKYPAYLAVTPSGDNAGWRAAFKALVMAYTKRYVGGANGNQEATP